MVDALLKVVPTMMSVNVLSHNLKYLKKKKKKSSDLIEQGVGNIVGVSMTKEVADFIG